jgi:NitT/TauT family transport system permease protein
MSTELIAQPAAADDEFAPAGRRRLRVALTLGVFVLVLLVWELGLRVTETPAYVLPPPSLVLARLIDGLIGGSLLRHTLVTVQEVLGGYLLGAALGIGLGVLISQYPLLDDVLYPYVVALNSVPKVAVSPLIVLWFGLGFQSKIIIAALVAFFPLLVNVTLGLKSADPEQIDLMRGLTASRWQIFTMVQLPNALPSIFAGLEVAIVLSVVGAIVGEFVGAKEGLGYFIQLSNALVDTAGMFAAFILLALVGWLLNQAVKLAARKIVFWRRSTVIVESA